MQFQGIDLSLTCWPPVPDHVARAWDAADELLLQQAQAQANTLLINDRYGALQTSLPHAHSWADSRSAMESAARNLAANNRNASGVVFTDEAQLPNGIEQVLIKAPKQFEVLQFWLSECQQKLPASTRYLISGMVKHWPVSWLNWLEQQAGSYRQSPIERKARLVEITLEKTLPAPKKWLGYRHNNIDFKALPGVFARDRIDIGSSVLLANSDFQLTGVVCDLGCGNGLLGLTLAKQANIHQLIMTDDSYVAVRSARFNAEQAGINADVRHGDCLEAVTEELDWVLCNPPFHDGHKQLTNIAANMFRDSANRLKTDGQMLIIANRHLPYVPLLKRYFKTVNSLGKDPRFSIYHCQYPIHKSRP